VVASVLYVSCVIWCRSLNFTSFITGIILSHTYIRAYYRTSYFHTQYSNCTTFSKGFIIDLYIMSSFDILIIRAKQALVFSVYAFRPTFLPASCKIRDNTLNYHVLILLLLVNSKYMISSKCLQ
jgi:hypothetical protein